MENLFENRTYRDLPIMSCSLIDLPMEDDGSYVDCIWLDNSSTCIRCEIRGRYFTQEGIMDSKSTGHIICILLWMVTFLIGILAIFGNFVIIVVLKKRNSGQGFDKFLIGLAICDVASSVLSIIGTTTITIISQNWNTGMITQFIYLYSSLFGISARSASVFITVVITIERYLVIAFPVKFGKWFTPQRSTLITTFAILPAILLGIPRLSSFMLVKNTFGKFIKSIIHFDYIIVSTSIHKLWYETLFGFFDIIDFWMPLPLLLIFNGLVYYHIRKFAARRKRLNSKHSGDIRAARMFLPVVIVIFLCNILSIIYYWFAFNRIVYRELRLGSTLSYVINSAVNLPIYYFGGASFRMESKYFLARLFPSLKNVIGNNGSTEIQSAVSASKNVEIIIESSNEFENERYA